MVLEGRASGQRTWDRRCLLCRRGLPLGRGLRQSSLWSRPHTHIAESFPSSAAEGQMHEQESRNCWVLTPMRGPLCCGFPLHTTPHQDPSLVVLGHSSPMQMMGAFTLRPLVAVSTSHSHLPRLCFPKA